MNIREAIEAPRIHHQWMPDSIFYEQKALNPELRIKLIEMGYHFWDEGAESRWLGIAEGILIDNNNGIIYGTSDPRGGGLAIGY
jgi:gamma-glutamyltranspeptidase/glutathione hydrolase